MVLLLVVGSYGVASTSSQVVVWGNESVTIDSSDALCYKVEWNLNAPGFRPSKVLTPIHKMPSVHPSVKNTLCGMRLAAGDPIPANGAGPYSTSGTCQTNLSAGILFYGWSYPQGWAANTGYYEADAMTVYMIVDSAGQEFLVMTLDAPWSGTGGYLGLDVCTAGSIPGPLPCAPALPLCCMLFCHPFSDSGIETRLHRSSQRGLVGCPLCSWTTTTSSSNRSGCETRH